jgi:hypothetical protein
MTEEGMSSSRSKYMEEPPGSLSGKRANTYPGRSQRKSE